MATKQQKQDKIWEISDNKMRIEKLGIMDKVEMRFQLQCTHKPIDTQSICVLMRNGWLEVHQKPERLSEKNAVEKACTNSERKDKEKQIRIYAAQQSIEAFTQTNSLVSLKRLHSIA